MIKTLGGCAFVAAVLVPISPHAEPSMTDEPMSCAFEIQARNTDSHDIYLDLYTSRVKNHAAYITAYKQLKMQNARVGPNKILSSQNVTVNGRCNATRSWKIYWRPSSNSSTRTKIVGTDKSTRASSSSGRRVLNLGDVGRW